MKKSSTSLTEVIYDQRYSELAAKTDRVFGYLFVFQWLIGVAFAYIISPKTWAGASSETHIHIFAAVFLGGAIAGYPIYLIRNNPGEFFTRTVVAVSQILFSILFIHLTGGRIETHFHVFGSLAFLAIYRDWRPVAVATIITAADHLLRGAFWPESVYGVLSATPWRALEHAAWVVFEDSILFYSIWLARMELWTAAEAHAEVAKLNESLETKVQERTRELQMSKQKVMDQQEALITSSKMSALGEMAGGMAHEINTPLAVIGMRVEQMEECLAEGDVDSLDFVEGLAVIKKTTDRIAKVVNGLTFFAREGRRAAAEKVKVSNIIEETLALCQERFANHGVQLNVIRDDAFFSAEMECRSVEISQVILNLLINSFDAIEDLKDKWVKLTVVDTEAHVEIAVTDCGNGIPKDIQDKLMQPFFTTKPVGQGTGLGLSISKGIVEAHKGRFYIDSMSPNTRFVMNFPKAQTQSSSEEKAA